MLSALQSVPMTLALLNRLGEGNEEVRAAASQVLKILMYFDQRQEQKGARERFLLLAAAPEPEVALQAALALGGLGDQRAVEPLLRLLPLYPGKREIIQRLGHLRASSAAELLFSRLNPHDANIDVQRDVIKALEQIEGPHVVERLLPWLHAGPETSQECAFQQALLASLARQGDARLVEPLLHLLNPHPKSLSPFDFQLHLLEALGNLGERQAIERLAQVLVLDPGTGGTYERRFQEYLVKTLKQLGDTRAELLEVEASLQRLKASTSMKTSVWFRFHTDDRED